jgi:hypothetical protein
MTTKTAKKISKLTEAKPIANPKTAKAKSAKAQSASSDSKLHEVFHALAFRLKGHQGSMHIVWTEIVESIAKHQPEKKLVKAELQSADHWSESRINTMVLDMFLLSRHAPLIERLKAGEITLGAAIGAARDAERTPKSAARVKEIFQGKGLRALEKAIRILTENAGRSRVEIEAEFQTALKRMAKSATK